MHADSRALPRLSRATLREHVYLDVSGSYRLTYPLRRHLRLVNLTVLAKTPEERAARLAALYAHDALFALS